MLDYPENIKHYLDSTFLKTSFELDVKDDELKQQITDFIIEAIDYQFKCVMIRPKFVALAKEIKDKRKAKINIGTVIDFPLGQSSCSEKVSQAKKALDAGAKELDFVCDYNMFKRNSLDDFDDSIIKCTSFSLKGKAIVKWIIETGALSKKEIKSISKRIYDLVLANFPNNISKVYIKTSTGYYGGFGATVKDLKIIKSVVGEMPVKASGGVSSFKSAMEMINLGVSRIGTSKAKKILEECKK
jgi:deoxyribose-phosphate aldolase